MTSNTILTAKRSLLAVLALSSGACTPNTHPFTLSIRTVEDTVALRVDPEKLSFNVTAIARNDDPHPVELLECRTSAQRDIDGQWITIFTPFCTTSGATMVASRDSITMAVAVYGFSAPNMLPRADPRMVAGRYRLVFVAREPTSEVNGPPSAVQTIPSLPFFVTESDKSP